MFLLKHTPYSAFIDLSYVFIQNKLFEVKKQFIEWQDHLLSL